jgi:serine O-acetyltransferase
MDCRQQKIVDALLGSYQDTGGINHVDCATLPSKDAIAELCQMQLQLLFPGFFTEAVQEADLVMITGELVEEVRKRLLVEVSRSLRIRNGTCADNDSETVCVICDYLQQLPAVRKLLQTDVQAAFDGDPAASCVEEVILAYPGLEAIAIQRLAHELYKLGVPVIPRMMTEWAHGRTGIDIHPGASIGTHFFIDHGTGVVIGETTQIGNHVKLYQGVGLVAKSLAAGQALRGKKRHPTLEDHVTVYANATIVGGDTVIGAGSTIGASVFLMGSVEPDHVVALGQQDNKVTTKRAASAAARQSQAGSVTRQSPQ